MNAPQPLTLEAVATHFGLAIEYPDDLPDHAPGHLDKHDPPRYIAIDSRQSLPEQRFTLAHELGHLLLHRRPRPRRWYHILFERKWKHRPVALFFRTWRRWVSRNFTREFEADMIAVILLLQLRQTNDLRAYMENHPEKNLWVLYFCLMCAARGIQKRVFAAIRTPFTPTTEQS